MRPRIAALLLVLGAAGLLRWRAELFTVSRPGEAPRPLARAAGMPPPTFDVSLPLVPVGATRLTPGGRPLLVHYWAPWVRHSRAQVLALDSLARTLPPDGVRIAVVCFDPFPSVARYVARLRLHVPVMLDLRRDLQAALPCPSLPYTWLLDSNGHVLAAQPGEVDWLAPATRELLLAPDASPRADTATALAPESAKPRRSVPAGLRERSGVQARAAAAVRSPK